jgi:hypothetical protein
LLAFLLFAACGGGGGGGGSPFRLNGSSPEGGSTDASFDAPVLLVFNRPADTATVTRSNITFVEEGGRAVPFDIFVQGFNASSVSVAPLQNLKQNVRHTITLGSGIKATDGTALRPQTICFVTRSVTPTVRPDQVIDMGDALNVPRFLPETVRLTDGRVLLIGGYKNAQEATDTIELFDPSTRTFRLLDSRMSVPRAEHTATLTTNGRVVITGGVAFADGPPLASVDILSVGSEAVTPGPPLFEARREHSASTVRSGEDVLVAGGYDTDGEMKDSIERYRAGAWTLLAETLAEPTAEGIQISWDSNLVYFSPSNLQGIGSFYDGTSVFLRQESDIRFRAAWARIGSGRFVIIGGDTRSGVTYLFDSNVVWGGTDFLFDRRGAHSLTARGLSGRRLLIAGGFNIAQLGSPALNTLEIVDAIDPGRFGFPDLLFYKVENLQLPKHFAGHAGFTDRDGATILAGGFGDGVGEHSRRVVMILDEDSSPTISCD